VRQPIAPTPWGAQPPTAIVTAFAVALNSFPGLLVAAIPLAVTGGSRFDLSSRSGLALTPGTPGRLAGRTGGLPVAGLRLSVVFRTGWGGRPVSGRDRPAGGRPRRPA
jgi:hypothetical protein